MTLVEDGCALFPDAPTERGRRHVRTLMEAKREGMRAAGVEVYAYRCRVSTEEIAITDAVPVVL